MKKPSKVRQKPMTRPVYPRSADVSVVLAYYHALERYTDELERIVKALKKDRDRQLQAMKDYHVT